MRWTADSPALGVRPRPRPGRQGLTTGRLQSFAGATGRAASVRLPPGFAGSAHGVGFVRGPRRPGLRAGVELAQAQSMCSPGLANRAGSQARRGRRAGPGSFGVMAAPGSFGLRPASRRRARLPPTCQPRASRGRAIALCADLLPIDPDWNWMSECACSVKNSLSRARRAERTRGSASGLDAAACRASATRRRRASKLRRRHAMRATAGRDRQRCASR